MKISKRFVDSIKSVEKQKIEWDADLKGFGVVVRPSGVIPMFTLIGMLTIESETLRLVRSAD